LCGLENQHRELLAQDPNSGTVHGKNRPVERRKESAGEVMSHAERSWRGRRNRAAGIEVLTGSLYERIRSALDQIRSKMENRTKKIKTWLNQKQNWSDQPLHNREKNLAWKNKYQGARAQNEDLISELIRPP
jgi:hypothetical protein